MAATVTSAWAKPGAWALDSEEHEEELKQEQTPAPSNGRATAAAMSDFPDLMTAAATKTKKKKGQTLSLSEFVTGSTNKPTGQTYQAAKGLTAEDMMMLPTGPRQRTAEELDRTRLGGGFRSYGDRNNESSNSRWGSGRTNGGGDEGRKSTREPLGPSRADEIDDWGAAKKSTTGFDRRERGGGFFEGSHSRADESNSWGSNKSYTPSEGRRNGGFDRERRMGFESSGDADTSDNWGKKKEVRFGGGGGGAFDSLRERRGGNDSSDSDNWGKKREEVSVGGGGGRPKLNLQPRKIPVADGESVVAVKPTKGSNPFGDARPREQVLKEKGEDWKEMDEKLEAMKIKDLGSGDRLKRGIGRPRSNEDSTERNWRKNQAVDVPNPLPSDEKNENGHMEVAEEAAADVHKSEAK
ncbi:eukaryotic translation initiation factor 4B3 [Cynara cardunculus var. scolymus]|uniref:eukaryotic translation initiation factor 4B3 n=1 Tax=Cynara cardunculus var. scolymus TaxID=59895 RepID=UPI000D62B4AD|nr:eukaryotic translation initiation factor 4B3 [Cynara cardunculus var. scolymus]